MNTRRQFDIIRHAESLNEPLRKKVGGRTTELALSEIGRFQAMQLGIEYGPLDDEAALYSSPARRTIDTAEIAFPLSPIQLDTRLAETSRGIHEDMPIQEVYTKEFFDAQWELGFDHKSPGGESLNQAADRLQRFLDEIEHGNVAVGMSHSRVTKALIARYLGFSFENFQDRKLIDISNTSVSRFENHGAGWQVTFYGRSALEVAIEDRKQGRRSA